MTIFVTRRADTRKRQKIIENKTLSKCTLPVASEKLYLCSPKQTFQNELEMTGQQNQFTS